MTRKIKNLPHLGKAGLPHLGKADSPNLPHLGKADSPQNLPHLGKALLRNSYHGEAEGEGKRACAAAPPAAARDAAGGLDMPTRDFMRWDGQRFHRNRTTFKKQNPGAESRTTPVRKAEPPPNSRLLALA